MSVNSPVSVSAPVFCVEKRTGRSIGSNARQVAIQIDRDSQHRQCGHLMQERQPVVDRNTRPDSAPSKIPVNRAHDSLLQRHLLAFGPSHSKCWHVELSAQVGKHRHTGRGDKQG